MEWHTSGKFTKEPRQTLLIDLPGVRQAHISNGQTKWEIKVTPLKIFYHTSKRASTSRLPTMQNEEVRKSLTNHRRIVHLVVPYTCHIGTTTFPSLNTSQKVYKVWVSKRMVV